MRRWLALFLLVLLPLLSGWSVASAYCDDPSNARAGHVEHHDGKHHDAGADRASDESRSPATHADCDHCHSPGVTRLSPAADVPVVAPNLRTTWTDVALRAPPLALPERPKWTRLA